MNEKETSVYPPQWPTDRPQPSTHLQSVCMYSSSVPSVIWFIMIVAYSGCITQQLSCVAGLSMISIRSVITCGVSHLSVHFICNGRAEMVPTKKSSWGNTMKPFWSNNSDRWTWELTRSGHKHALFNRVIIIAFCTTVASFVQHACMVYGMVIVLRLFWILNLPRRRPTITN
jgi:hypothetical protein